VVGVGRAAAGAVQLGPAVPALGPGAGVQAAEFGGEAGIGDAVPDVADAHRRLGRELMAGEQVALGRDREVLRAGAAAGQALDETGAVGQVDHVVVEGEGTALALPLQHLERQRLVLVHQERQVLVRQRAGVAGGGHHRLHADLGEAQVRDVQDVA